MIYDFNTFRLAMMEVLIALRDEARWTPMQRMEIAAAVGRIEDAVCGRFAMPTRVILMGAGLSCPRLTVAEAQAGGIDLRPPRRLH